MTKDAASDSGVRAVEHQWIAMADGTRLSARMWFPPEAEADGGARFAAILEIIPYRKRDLVRARDERNHPVFAANGYVCLRVDMRGSGDSEGRMPDMYAPEELSDTREVIAWIAAQPWSSGRVGMIGTSWGGTASLQAAVDAPGPLKAVLANCATTDRFEDDIHWMGGCLLTDCIEWGATLPAILASPPDAASVGDGWRDQWRRRLEGLTFPLERWAQEARRGAYWRRGSVRFRTEDLNCPVLAVGGWSDRYAHSVTPLVDARPDLCWGVVGPWGHHYPDHGEPGPAIDFQALALAWFDHWLKSATPGALDWPKLRLWRRAFDPPQDRLSERVGAWVSAPPAGDSSETETRFLLGADGALLIGESASAAGAGQRAVPFDLGHGAAAGDTGYFGRVGGLPLDQTPDDVRALCFDSAPLPDAVDLTGAAILSLTVKRKERAAQLVARLCDVAPDGRSALVTRAALNLALDADLDAERPFSPDAPQEVELRFPTTAYRLAPGHRLRLALGGSYWPLVWPTPRDPAMRVAAASLSLRLPARADTVPTAPPAPPPGARPAAPRSWQVVEGPPLERTLTRQEGDGTVWTAGWRQPRTAMAFSETGLVLRFETEASYRVSAAEPVVAACLVRHRLVIERPDGVAEVEGAADVQSRGEGLSVTSSLDARFDGEAGFCRRGKVEL